MVWGTSFNREEEFAGPNFHSVWLEERFVRTMETLIEQPDVSIWEASEDRAEAKSIYLAVQDAASVNYNTRLKTEGIGRVSGKTPGVNVHSRLAANADGLVLGVLDQSGYNREGAKAASASHESKKVRPIEGKERFWWLESLGRSTADIPEGINVITICDREGDMAD
ncbi:MAG: hypothetical protein LBF60_08800 [Treponema sp.]|jgi:hypothetical protein|nr:hypothetical protein [Treponema sp.]